MLGGGERLKTLDLFRLDGKVAVVTGGARALGFEHSKALAEAGADVAICDLLEDEGAKAAAAIAESTGRRTYFGRVDVTRPEQIDEFVANVSAQLGPIDILVNNAARPSEGVALETVEDDLWRNIIDTNLSSLFYFGSRVARQMIDRGKGGSIINVASVNANAISNIFPRHNVTYCVAKAGIAHLTRGMASEWAQYNIRVNTLAPGHFLTPQTSTSAQNPEIKERIITHTPMKRYGNPDELRGAIVYLASDASTFMTGSMLVVDGGYLVY